MSIGKYTIQHERDEKAGKAGNVQFDNYLQQCDHDGYLASGTAMKPGLHAQVYRLVIPPAWTHVEFPGSHLRGPSTSQKSPFSTADKTGT
jgi:hypothetical protein